MPPKQKRKKALKGQDATSRKKVLGRELKQKSIGLRYKGLYQLTPLQRLAILRAQAVSARKRRSKPKKQKKVG